MFDILPEKAKLSQTLAEASITLLLKPGEYACQCSFYRPISLIHVNVKILAKLSASRMESITPNIILPDQTGFIRLTLLH